MLCGKRTQSARPWKYINYVSDRAQVEMKWNLRMLDTEHIIDASHAAFKRVCEHIRYEHRQPIHNILQDAQSHAQPSTHS